ncbi:MAG: hypothetical protein WC209_08330 [Ignavibacteriaceae bacterium]|jgi:hypothetical protein
MKLFVIHRFKDRKNAKKKLKNLARDLSIEFHPIFLDSYGGSEWKQKAEKAISQAEATIVFNPISCSESDNAKWEIEKAKEAKREIIELDINSNDETTILKLKSIYELKEEFGNCFSSESKDDLELYKLMIESSESLIQRRQKTSAFFITVIGSLLAIAGLLVKTGTINPNSIGILYGFSVVGLLLCNSWRNLIDNYGKLNKAKFDVILRLEKNLGSQIYSAEWIALGKGLRPKKYKSFTATEKNVPLFFGLLIIVLTLIAAVSQIWG